MNKALAFLILAFTLCPVPSWAATYHVNFCAKYSVDFEDASSGVLDDFWTNNTDKAARGVRIKVESNSDPDPPVYYDYTDYTGVNEGCTGVLTLSSTDSYLVRIYSEALVGGNYIYVRNNPTNDQRFYTTIYSAFVPSQDESIDIDTPIGRHWNIAAAAGYTQYRRRGGLTGETYILYDEECDGGGSCNDGGEIYLSPDVGAVRKYVIAHEMGHALAAELENGTYANFDYTASLGGCYTVATRDHEINSKEYQSAAANEGFAHFYSAVVFNDDTETDCHVEYYKTVDWDLDGTVDDQTTDCESGPVNGADYLGDSCIGTITNRGVEYDWLRFWWDLTTDEGVYFTDCGHIWDRANPWSWNATGDSTGLNYPATRLRDAADTEGFLTEWDAKDNFNGVHR